VNALALGDAADQNEFGGKAAQLGAAIRAGLPVPTGIALSAELVDALAEGNAAARAAVDATFRKLGPPLAARSSAVGEDSGGASFAGQHATKLGVYSSSQLTDAILAVRASAFAPAALAYRQRLGIIGRPRMAVVVQKLVDPDCAGVLFTRNPMDGTDERVIEAAWGLGEAVVQGLVTPDRYRVGRDGRIIERAAGEKDLMLRPSQTGVEEHPVDDQRAAAHCLDDEKLTKLHDLALACEGHFGRDLDLEWAYDGPALFLLQQRPITRFVSA
jgi:pyruvate, water dikinase